MSAFMVDDGHIDYLVTAVRRLGVTEATIPAVTGLPNLDTVQIDTLDDTELGRILLGTNLSSMIARYGDRLTSQELEAVDEYEYQPWAGPSTDGWTIKVCECYAYQCNEYDGWEDSLARCIIERIEGRLHDRAGYDDAPWEVTRPTADQPTTTEGA